MQSKTIICAIAAASFSFASLSFAQNYERPGQARSEQRSPQGHDAPHPGQRGFDPRDNRNGPPARPRDFERHDIRQDRYHGARGPQFHRGGRIPAEYRNRQYVVNNWRAHRLYAPPRGQQWVQVGSDYALIAIATGVIAQLILSQ